MILKWYFLIVLINCIIFHLDKLIFNALIFITFSIGYLFYHYQKTKDNFEQSLFVRAKNPIKNELFSIKSENLLGLTRKIITNSNSIDDELNAVIDLIIHDFIESWYKTQISNKNEFCVEIKELLSQVFTHLTIFSKNIDWEQFILNTLANNFVTHMRLFKKAKEKTKKSTDELILIDTFFDLEAEFEKGVCRDEISYLSSTKEYEYLQELSEFLCYTLMPEGEFNLVAYRCLIREILANKIFKDFIDNLSEPDNINQSFLWLLKNQPILTENFLITTSFNSNFDELNEIRAKIDEEIALLRSKDKGGDQDQEIKLQLSSLQYLLKKINNIITNKNQTESSPDDDIQFIDSSLINFDALLTNEQTQHCFIEYMGSQNSQNLISFYLNAQIYYKFAKKELESPKDASKIAMQDFAKGLINAYLIQNTPEDIINISNIIFYRDELNATLERMENLTFIDEFLLTELQSKIYQLMRQKYFPGFKRSPEFQKLLAKNESLKAQISFDCDSIEQYCDGNETQTSIELQNADCSNQNQNFNITAIITSCGKCNDLKQKYAIYIIDVKKIYQETNSNNKNEFWQTYRRFNDFHDLHLTIKKKFSQLQNLNLPGKSFRSSLNDEFLEKRQKELNKYLQTLCNPHVLSNNPGLMELLLNFLENKRWDSSQTNITRKFDSFFTPVISSVRNIEATIKNAPENVANIVKEILPETPIKQQNSIDKEFMNIQKNITDDSQNNIFLKLSLVLIDEIFDLKEKSQWFRQSLISILKGYIRNFKGNSVNKKIKEHIADYMSEESIARFIKRFRKRVWPKGVLADRAEPRSKSVVEITKVLTKTKLLSVVSDELRTILSSEITRQGLYNLFEMFQYKTLNKRFIYVVIENLFVSLFQQNLVKDAQSQNQVHSFLSVYLSKSNRVKEEWKNLGEASLPTINQRKATRSESFFGTVQC